MAQDGRINRRELATLPLAATATALASGAAGATTAPALTPTLEQRARIDDLFTAYVWAYDCSAADAFIALFDPDDPVVVGRGQLHRGERALRDWFAYLHAIRESESALWLHQALHHVYRPVGDGWLVYSYATHFGQPAAGGGSQVRSLGYFVSEVVMGEAGYRFRRFSINSWDAAALPWTKPLPWDDPALPG